MRANYCSADSVLAFKSTRRQYKDYFKGEIFPGKDRSPEATLKTFSMQSNGEWTLSFTRRPAVTPSNLPSDAIDILSRGTRTSIEDLLKIGEYPGLSIKIGNPGQVFGILGFVPGAISFTFIPLHCQRILKSRQNIQSISN